MTTVLIFLAIDSFAHPVGEFAGRKFGSVDLLDGQILPLSLLGSEIDAHDLHAVEQQAKLFIEDEQRSLLASCDGRFDKRHDDERFARAGRSQDQRAGSGFDAAAHQCIELRDAGRELGAGKLRQVFRRNQTRERP